LIWPTYVNTTTHQNRLKPIQPNYKNSFVSLFVCKWGNHSATMLRINMWPVSDRLFGAPSKSVPGARAPLAPPKGWPCIGYMYYSNALQWSSGGLGMES
jgi:hypothetical protein